MSKNTSLSNTKKRGRPRKYASAAERQRAYRQRLQARGFRVQARVVRADDAPLRSGVIDLSACRR
jgi:hypothetical protein